MERRSSIAREFYDTRFETYKSIGMYILCFKMFVYIAFNLIAIGTKEMTYKALEITEKTDAKIGDLVFALRLYVISKMLIQCIITLFGIIGYLVLCRYFIAFHCFNNFVIIVWYIILLFIEFTQVHNDIQLSHFFKTYKENAYSKFAVHTIQCKWKCCGSGYFSYENSLYPPSCCPPEFNTTCTEEHRYKKLCVTQRRTFITYLKRHKLFSKSVILAVGGIIIESFEIFIGLNTIKRITRHMSNDIFDF